MWQALDHLNGISNPAGRFALTVILVCAAALAVLRVVRRISNLVAQEEVRGLARSLRNVTGKILRVAEATMVPEPRPRPRLERALEWGWFGIASAIAGYLIVVLVSAVLLILMRDWSMRGVLKASISVAIVSLAGGYFRAAAQRSWRKLHS
jgi:hypothetical protein